MKFQFKRILFFVFCFSFFSNIYAQKGVFHLEGLVHAIEYDPVKKALKKNKETVLKGLLANVTVKVFQEKKLFIQTKTNKQGYFDIQLPFYRIYKLELYKEGFERRYMLIDLEDIPKSKMKYVLDFNGTEFLLNNYIKQEDNAPMWKDEPIGTLFYNAKTKQVDFKENENRVKKKGGLFGKDVIPDNSPELIAFAVKKNEHNDFTKKMVRKRHYKIQKDTLIIDSSAYMDTILTIKSELKITPEFKIEEITPENILEREDEIEKARKQLELDKQNIQTPEDSLLIVEREAIIQAAERELEDAKYVIRIQQSEIKNQRKALYATLFAIVLLVGGLGLLFYFFRERKRTNAILEDKNKKILDSIGYAKRIQESILVEIDEITNFLQESFIYFQPRDIVSGDFYWFTVMDEKIVFAAIDCTGHGVPGAFMTLIGNTLLNQIVIEKKELDPGAILEKLHLGIKKSLQQHKGEDQSQDGMDMALCVIDKEKNEIQFAGAMNPLYIVENNKIDVVAATIKSIGGVSLRPDKEDKRRFETKTVKVKRGMSFYMFSDGYMDQFGGKESEKLNTPRFKDLLLSINSLPMAKQKDKIKNFLADWMGIERQIDDILVIGFKL